jgi:hypothetical protein
MNRLLWLASISALNLLVGGCAMYQPDPAAEACNIGGPLGKLERSLAMEPNPGSVPGRPAECRMGRDGVLRLPSAAAR